MPRNKSPAQNFKYRADGCMPQVTFCDGPFIGRESYSFHLDRFALACMLPGQWPCERATGRPAAETVCWPLRDGAKRRLAELSFRKATSSRPSQGAVKRERRVHWLP